MRIRDGKFREPDLAALLDRADPRNQDRFWLGADLALEVVSPDDPDRDFVAKRADYAEAGIAEYWIVDPKARRLRCWRLMGCLRRARRILTWRRRGFCAAERFLLGCERAVSGLEGLGRPSGGRFKPASAKPVYSLHGNRRLGLGKDPCAALPGAEGPPSARTCRRT